MKRMKWPIAWLLEIVEMAAAGVLTALAHIPGGAVSALASWAFMPAAGLSVSLMATRRGLLNYAAWIAPPVCMALTHYLLWRYLPDAGPVLLCAFVSVIGAAAGQVIKERDNGRRK